uniref:wiskott-Aldrich syndrome protein homolog 1-like isoform X3 n=1 Tax=Ictidomys tridecemlineatus TaxID=43179 RepID=UPI001A9DBFF2|nr:wiskott-Aldrich syndrome protein homolog 1-like isoform X3 [Ictidomys tridecemlineatus]
MGTRAPRGHLPLPALQKPVSRARSSSPVPNGPTGRKSRPAARPWPGRPPSPLPHPAPRDRRAGVAKATEEGADYISHPPPRRAPVRLSVRPSVRAQKGPGVGPAAAPWTALRRLPSLGTGNLVTCAVWLLQHSTTKISCGRQAKRRPVPGDHPSRWVDLTSASWSMPSQILLWKA